MPTRTLNCFGITSNHLVVTGYGSQKRSNISGSVSTVNAEEIAERPITRVEQALQGRVAGVQVAQVSGSPGSAQTVRILNLRRRRVGKLIVICSPWSVSAGPGRPPAWSP